MDQFFSILVKCRIKEFLSYQLNLVSDLLFTFWSFMSSKLSFVPLGINVMLQLNDIQKFPLQHFKSIFQLAVFRTHSMEKFLLILTHH